LIIALDFNKRRNTEKGAQPTIQLLSNSSVNVTLDERRSYTGKLKCCRVTELNELLREGELEKPETLAQLPDSLKQYPILVRYAFSEDRNGTFATTAPPFNYYHDLKYILDGICMAQMIKV